MTAPQQCLEKNPTTCWLSSRCGQEPGARARRLVRTFCRLPPTTPADTRPRRLLRYNWKPCAIVT